MGQSLTQVVQTWVDVETGVKTVKTYNYVDGRRVDSAEEVVAEPAAVPPPGDDEPKNEESPPSPEPRRRRKKPSTEL